METNTVVSVVQEVGVTGVLDTISIIVGQFVVICTAIIVIAQRIPGKQPEATLQKIVDFIAKFSKK